MGLVAATKDMPSTSRLKIVDQEKPRVFPQPQHTSRRIGLLPSQSGAARTFNDVRKATDRHLQGVQMSKGSSHPPTTNIYARPKYAQARATRDGATALSVLYLAREARSHRHGDIQIARKRRQGASISARANAYILGIFLGHELTRECKRS